MFERVLTLILDAIAINLAMASVFLFRFLGLIPPDYLTVFLVLALPYTLICLFSYWVFGLYRHSPRSVGITQIVALVKAGIFVTLAFGAVSFLIPSFRFYPRSVILYAAIVSPSFLIGWRLALRFLESLKRKQPIPSQGEKTLIVGAGVAGQRVVQMITNFPESNLRLIGYVDDDPAKKGYLYQQFPVLGPLEDLPRIVKESNVTKVILAIPSASTAVLGHLMDLCQHTGARLLVLPSLRETFTHDFRLSQLREPVLDDIIGKQPVSLDPKVVAPFLSGKRILITGAGGSIGMAIAKEVAKFNPGLLILLDHGENSLYETDLELGLRYPQLKRLVLMGDIRDLARMEQIMREYLPAVIFHAASTKHIPLNEYSPDEAVKTNVIGTKNLAILAESYGVSRFINLSTDKTVKPTSVLGSTKRVAEMVLQDLAARSKTKFISIRFGNVLGSQGSLFQMIDKQLEFGNTITITHPEMTRYFLSLDEAANLILQSAVIANENEVLVIDAVQPIAVQGLVEQYIALKTQGERKDIRIVYTGVRPGEKIREDSPDASEPVVPSGFDRILIAQPAQFDQNGFAQSLNRLEKAALEGKGERVIRILQGMIPDYHPQRDFFLPKVVDATRPVKRKRFGEIALEMGFLSEEKLLQAIDKQEAMAVVDRKPIGQILLDLGELNQAHLQEILDRLEMETKASIKGILGEQPAFDSVLPIVQPTLPAMSDLGKEFSNIVLNGILTKGRFIEQFERAVAEYLGVNYAVALSSCTLGLILTCYALELKGEVIVPSFTFSATVHALAWNRLTPVFADCSPGDLNLDPERVERLITDKTAAILAVHIFGNPSRIEELQTIADRHGIPLIFDAAHGFGSLYRDQPLGRYGIAEVFSTSPTKLLVTGEGGVVTTAEKGLALRLKVLREYGNPGDYDSIYPGVNARMAEINALLGLKGLPQLETHARQRNELVSFYRQKLAQLPGISFQSINPLGRSSYKDFTILVDESQYGLSRDQLSMAMSRENIQTKKYYSPPLHLQKAYSNYREQYRNLLPVTEDVSNKALSLPIYSHMEFEMAGQICQVIERIHANAPAVRTALETQEGSLV